MKKIVITGGTGFVGRNVLERLFERNSETRLVVPTRRLANGRQVALLPTVDLVECNVHDPAALPGLLHGADALVHLVAILHGSESDFDRAHVQLPRHLAAACAAAGVQRVVHVSALGVAAHAPSAYLRSKAAGEAVWQQAAQLYPSRSHPPQHALDITLLRPSVIFGAEDRFTNLFVALQRVFPLLPLAGADAKFQPVWVGDVAQAVVNSLYGPRPDGAVIECAGPEVLTLEQIVQRVGAMAGCARPVLALPEAIGLLQATLMGLKPGEPLMSRDNVLSMRVPNVASGDGSAHSLPGLAALGITPASLDTLAAHFCPPDPRRP